MSHRRPHSVSHAQSPHLAMPLGGIGTGNVAIGSDGSLRQWQLHNIGNHEGALPFSFFSLRVSTIEPPLDQVRILQARVPAHEPTPLVNDDLEASWQASALDLFGPVSSTAFSSTYPFANVTYLDESLPLDIELEAFTPLVPFDVADSSLPVALFAFTLRNRSAHAVHGHLGSSLLNAVGWDGVSPLDGVRGAGLGGNTNRVLREDGWTSVVLENGTLDPKAAGAGQMVIATDHAAAAVLPQWRTLDEYHSFLRSRSGADGRERLSLAPMTADAQRHTTGGSTGASASGETWATAIVAPFALEPGEEVTLRFTLAWHFPNRYVNFEQFGPARPEWAMSSFWLGNAYAGRHADAQAVLRDVVERWPDLARASRSWSSIFADSSLDDASVEHLAAQLSLLRSPTCFQSADGRFFGFEGVLGASTTMWNGHVGGSCPLNCTHVWNYAQVVAKVFPTLERNMRETEYDIMQAPEGYLPHRVIAPVYLPQLWDQVIGGPDEPALDGMLGSVLKSYREYRHGAGLDWLRHYWPNIVRLMNRISAVWDPQGTGVLRGIQPSTHDIDLNGVNSFMGTMWLAALRAAEECAVALGEDPQTYRTLFERGSAAYDELLFNGDYYRQLIEEGDNPAYQWGDGCLSDQLLGQWWAHELDLGYLLPQEHVRSALRAVVRNNLRTGFRDFEHGYRVYADLDDTGLLLCTWPRDGRPEVPLRYADEVWSGVEYQVAAHCFREGLVAEGKAILDGLWARHDGSRRNPYNEIECGDHYVRAMAGWSVLEAVTGYAFDAPSASLSFDDPGPEEVAWPFVTDRAWGLIRIGSNGVELECSGGTLELAFLRIGGHQVAPAGGIALVPGQTFRTELDPAATADIRRTREPH